MAEQRSLLDDLGEEVTGIVAPVSLCMAVTVLLVRLLNPEGVSSSNTVLIASIAYQEQVGRYRTLGLTSEGARELRGRHGVSVTLSTNGERSPSAPYCWSQWEKRATYMCRYCA